MKIAIYGDSFATGYDENIHFAWYNLLAKKLGGRIVDDKGREGKGIAWAGRSTYASYKNFLKYYQNYHFNIFIAGDPYRYIKSYYNEKMNSVDGPLEYNISNLNCVDPAVENEIIDKKEAEHFTGWFMMSDHDYLQDMQELILRDVEKKDPKCLIIPSQIETSFVSSRMVKMNMKFGLTRLYELQYTFMNSPNGYWSNKEPANKISCHYSPETNEWLANAVYDYLTNNKKLELPDHIPHQHDYRYYFDVE